MLPWRRQASTGSQQQHRRPSADSDGEPALSAERLQSAATLPAQLVGGGSTPTDSGSLAALLERHGGNGAGSLRHSYSCPPTSRELDSSSSSKAARQQQQQQQQRTSAVRRSQQLPPRAGGGMARLQDSGRAGSADSSGSASDASGHALDLPGDAPDSAGTTPGHVTPQQLRAASWGALQAYTGSDGSIIAARGSLTPPLQQQQHQQHQLQAMNGGGGGGHMAAHANGAQHYGSHSNGHSSHDSSQAQELERRKFTRNLLSANNKKESLERYKAIMALIEACRRRLEAQLGAAGAAAALADAAWCREPLQSLLQAVLDVGEALASFGNCHFPEHSNEARAILAGDYRSLLKQYLSAFGFVFAPPTQPRLAADMQEEVQCVGSLLATRCAAYDLLYDQLVRHVGLEGRGGGGGLQTLIVNTNSAAAHPRTSVSANPVNTNSASASSRTRAKLRVSGLGAAAAAAAAAALGAALLARGLRRGGGGGGGGKRGGGGGGGGGGRGRQQQGGHAQAALRVPKGRNGRELLLVGQLSGCADELRRASRNEELLRDDWRLGRHVRLSWPPGPPVPPGYEPVAADACNVTQLLQELYG